MGNSENHDMSPINGKNVMEEEEEERTTTVENGSKEEESAVESGVTSTYEAVSSTLSSLSSNIHTALSSIVDCHRRNNKQYEFNITPDQLSHLSQERNRLTLVDLLEKYVQSSSSSSSSDMNNVDVEAQGKSSQQVNSYIMDLVQSIRQYYNEKESSTKTNDEIKEQDQCAELAATTLATVLLRSSPEWGLSKDDNELQHRISTFGSNSIADKKLASFLQLCWEALQDFVLIMLICLGVVGIVVETTIGLDEGESCGHCWLEGFAILMSVCIVMLVTAGIDYAKQFAFKRLTDSLNESNTKCVIRDGETHFVQDSDLVVGDILSVNSHSLASIPADCVLLGPSMDLYMDESTLTGESKHISKKAGDVILSGTTAVQGSGKMVIIAVGTNSVAGKIKARVYESEDHDGDNELGGDEDSPLFVKLEIIAKQIGWAGTIAALLSFAVSCGIGFGYWKRAVKEYLVEYFMVAVTVLAVAVPEGLPLAVTLALAFSSNKMMKDQNLVKHLNACETMGCATTICTDKTGTLTANKMMARAIYTSKHNYPCDDPKVTLGNFILSHLQKPTEAIIDMIVKTISICTMNETVLTIDNNGNAESSGNPTEVALLQCVYQLGHDYRMIRNTTRGRSDGGDLAVYLSEGKQFAFSSKRKMMSWAVPLESGGFRIYSKGAAEVILDRCQSEYVDNGEVVPIEDSQVLLDTAEQYARRGMRCLGLAYRDLPNGVDFDEKSAQVKNSDGSDALEVETDLVFIALVGIEDPLRPEVPDAIEKCYTAGIDVRLVTGDSPNTAVSIAYQAGILKDFHFHSGGDMVAANLKDNVLMEGKEFRTKVYRVDGKKDFDQQAFDEIWPHLRVLARSSPDDKLTLAHGLNQSTLFMNKAACEDLLKNHNIKIFPDRQVIAMTGDGTNDAPALKRADIGFAMGIAGTQIAKDAADIILLDDNFASIVTAAKWGRNIYASIQKFLQFQLTVNIAAVISVLVGSFAYQKTPLAAIQLLWVNLLMDALASLALASEPPKDELLQKPPVNRSQTMIVKRMWANMLGQACYQIIVMMLLVFAGPDWFDLKPGHLVEKEDGINSVHYTLIFNAFVWMQLFNEVNSRNLNGEVNVFKGLLKNPLFVSILAITSVLQVIMVQFGGVAMHVHDDGLDWKFWGISIAIGSGSLPVQQIINLLYSRGSTYKLWREKKRLRRSSMMLARE